MASDCWVMLADPVGRGALDALMETFPTVETLAAAFLLIAVAMAGLGYYSRARRLHERRNSWWARGPAPGGVDGVAGHRPNHWQHRRAFNAPLPIWMATSNGVGALDGTSSPRTAACSGAGVRPCLIRCDPGTSIRR